MTEFPFPLKVPVVYPACDHVYYIYVEGSPQKQDRIIEAAQRVHSGYCPACHLQKQFGK